MEIDCGTCREALSAYLDGELPADQADRVRQHLARCVACARLLTELGSAGEELARGMGELARQAPPPGDLMAKVRGAVPPGRTPPFHEPGHGDRGWLASIPALKPASGLFMVQTEGEFVARFVRVLGLLLRAGRPLPRALALVSSSGDAGDRVSELEKLAARVEQGVALSEAMAGWPDLFPDYVREAVRAGEVSGKLAEVLSRLGDVLSVRQEVRQQVVSNLSYPVTVLALMGTVLAFAATTLGPRFSSLLARHGRPLPMVTEVVYFGLFRVLSSPLAWAIGVACVGLAYYLVVRRRLFRESLDALRLWVPVYRTVHGQYLLGWLSSLISTLIRGGVPVPAALGLAAGASENRVYGLFIRELQRDVASGLSLREALARSPIVPPDARQILSAGEEANCLEEAFGTVAHLYHQRLSAELKTFAGVFEPLMILVLGTLVAAFCFATYMPMFFFNSTYVGGSTVSGS
ncbi:MAG: type II secretion system F family protein [Candidatus Riflebacteria bacterium]|nr:type II secretion system F family protein [Candidatus Riflebacteria bacterium]